ncbi:MAG: methyltransferase domain-containing protein [Firmicutes bacterium]|nr:methyltransferase domain-containing protein [Bacillota bacterium]
MNIPRNAIAISHDMAGRVVGEGDIVVDATAGKGQDTLFLAKRVGDSGQVYSFDIQPQALQMTEETLEKEKMLERVTLVLDGHENIDKHIKQPIKLVMFNLGYLPGGDHKIHTKAETTIRAIQKGLEMLTVNGMIMLVVYHGGDSGFEEKNAVMDFIQTLDYKKYSVLVHQFVNRINHPPIAVCIEKIK